MPRILLVEDDQQLREILATLLADAGHEVTQAANGRVALAAMRGLPADVVVTDMLMPEMEGIETIQAIRREFPSVKIIVISGGGLLSAEACLQIAKSLRPDRSLAKPFAPQDLLAAVHELLSPDGAPNSLSSVASAKEDDSAR